jgi:hypothetical protein
MNSESRDALEAIAKRAGAIIDCPNDCGNEISAGDSDADSQAYAAATVAWKRGLFGSSDRDEVMAEMKGVLQDANIDCPQCERFS